MVVGKDWPSPSCKRFLSSMDVKESMPIWIKVRPSGTSSAESKPRTAATCDATCCRSHSSTSLGVLRSRESRMSERGASDGVTLDAKAANTDEVETCAAKNFGQSTGTTPSWLWPQLKA